MDWKHWGPHPAEDAMRRYLRIENQKPPLRVVEDGHDDLENDYDFSSRHPRPRFQATSAGVNRPAQASQQRAWRTLRWVALGLLSVHGLMVPSAKASTYQFTLSWTNTDSNVDSNIIERSLDGVNFTSLATVAAEP